MGGGKIKNTLGAFKKVEAGEFTAQLPKSRSTIKARYRIKRQNIT